MNGIAEVVLKHPSILGEGAIWSQRDGLLYWVDILDHKVFSYDPSTGDNLIFDVKEFPSTIVPREKGGALLTLKNGFAALDLRSGRYEVISEVSEPENNRFNDGKCDPAGRFWAGTMDMQLAPGKGNLYVLGPDLKVNKKLEAVSCSNGIVWTRDGKTMYYIDSLTQEVHGFDFDGDTGNVSNRRVVVRIPKETGLPDGMAIDEEDMLWVALFWGGCVNRYDPKSGRCIASIEVPGANLVTSCAFSGPELSHLYITTASCDYKEEDWKQWPDAGSLYIAEPGVRGIPSTAFKG